MKTSSVLGLLLTLTLTGPALADATAPTAPARSGIDPNTFIVGHPASPRWKIVHANAEHPAVLQARASHAAIDPNAYLVQPPASVRWLAEGTEPVVQLAAVPRVQR